VKNLIIVGDSFCTYSGVDSWPHTLANELNLNLICHGAGGQPWWNARNFLINLSPDIVEDAEFIVFAHTYGGRIPTLNSDFGMVDKSKSPKSEIETALHLYYKYINDQNFLDWAQEQWFYEISRTWGHKKLCHLHCFPWSLTYSGVLSGINIATNLTAISLNELGTTEFNLIYDKRSNHFNDHNNFQLGIQLAENLKSYSNRTVELDISKFDQTTNYWLERGTNWH
jgi:hypothetical protein